MNSLKHSTSHTDILLEFLEVCFHSILYLRNVYPPSIFTLKKKYNIPVHICLYPDLNSYISDVLKALKKFLSLNKLKEISFFILDASSKPVEKFVFNNIFLKPSTYIADSDLSLIKQVEEAFRVFCLKLSLTDSTLKPAKEHFSFRIFIKTEESTYSNICDDPDFEGFPWIAEERMPDNDFEGILPIQSLKNPLFQLDLYAEI